MDSPSTEPPSTEPPSPRLDAPVFFGASVVLGVLVLLTVLFPDAADTFFAALQASIVDNLSWYYVLVVAVIFVTVITFAVSGYGSIKLGPDHSEPDYSFMSWFAMLFAAGMGIGLMFFGVAEPVMHFINPPVGEGGTVVAAREAMTLTFFHWGLHAWAIYAVVALALAFFAYNKGLPLTIRSTFYPLLGDRVWGPVGNVIDVTAVLATIFGLATSLGFGAQQAAGGLEFLFGLGKGLSTQLLIIAGVTCVALISVVRGIDGGVKLLSNINMSLAFLLLLFVVVVGSVGEFVRHFGETLDGYASYILPLSNPFGREDTTFYHDWSIFYWAWWISWSPFVGMFIARVSRGRTVRQFLTAVIIVPTLVTMVWMAAFGGSGLDQIEQQTGQLADGIGDEALVLFQMLENLPLASMTSLLGIVLVLVFFVTSSDSGSLVIDSITSGGKTDAPVTQRVFWAIAQGSIAAVLLSLGGTAALDALQAGAVSTGLPFTFVLLAMCVSLAIGLRHERMLNQAAGGLSASR